MRIEIATKARRQALSLAAATFILSATPACVSSIEPDVDVMPAPSEDAAYFQALTKASKNRSVFKDFEARYTITATYLSPEFRAAFAKRLERVYKKNDAQFAEATNKAGFFVSLNSPDDDRVDLSNPQHWNVLLDTGEGPIKPIIVKRLTDKERWRAFFDGVNAWSSDYLIVFDTPSITANAADLVAKTNVRITFANADAQVNLTW